MDKKYLILFSSSAILFSSYYCYDIPAALNRSIIKSKSIFNTFNITQLYSIYAFPNIFVPLLLTLFFMSSIRSSFAVVLSVIVFFGQVIFSFALGFNSTFLMLLGRFLFGLGNETLFVILSNKIIDNFKMNISLALSIFISFGRLGIVANFILTPMIAKNMSPFISCVVGIGLLGLSVFINLILTYSNYKLPNSIIPKRTMQQNNDFQQNVIEQHIIRWEDIIKDVDPEKESDLSSVTSTEQFEESNTSDTKEKKQNIISPTISLLSLAPSTENVWKLPEKTDFNLLNENYLQETDSDLSFSEKAINSHKRPLTHEKPITKKQKKNESRSQNKSNQQKKLVENYLTDIVDDPIKTRTIHGSFYLLTVIAFLLSFVWAPFYNLGPMLMQSIYEIDQVKSSQLMGFIDAMEIFFFILSGYLADFFGGKFYMIFLGCILLMFSYILMALHANLFVTVLIMSLAAPLHSLYWSLVGNLCSVNYIPIAFALLSCQLNLSFTISPILYSFLIKKHHGFDIMVISSLILTIIINILCFILCIWNKKSGLGLNLKTK